MFSLPVGYWMRAAKNNSKLLNPFAQFLAPYLCKQLACSEIESVLMFYRKNVGTMERIARAIAGVLMIACALTAFYQSPLKWVLLGSGIVTILTGVMGICPACALAGRRSQS
jgi:hypothetical protein